VEVQSSGGISRRTKHNLSIVSNKCRQKQQRHKGGNCSCDGGQQRGA
jgi:hypothetical protein